MAPQVEGATNATKVVAQRTYQLSAASTPPPKRLAAALELVRIAAAYGATFKSARAVLQPLCESRGALHALLAMVAQGEPHSHVPAQALLAAATLDEGANRMMADGLGDQEAGALCALGRTRTAETELRIYALKVLARAVAAPAPEGEQAAAVAGRAAASAAASALRASMPAVVEAGAELLRALLNTKVGRAAAPGWPNAVGTAMQEAEARGDALSRDVRLIRREVELYADRAKARQARGEAP